MSKIALQGGITGTATFTIEAPTTSTNRTLTLPDATTTLAGTDATQTLTNKTLTSPTINGTPVMGASVITSGTSQASTSGTSIDFTGIPSWVKRVTVMFSGVSTNGTSNLQVQIGTGGSPTTSGYLGAVSYIAGTNTTGSNNFTTGFGIVNAVAATHIYHGLIIISLLDSSANRWAYSSSVARSDTTVNYMGAGSVALSGVLNLVRITTANGTDTFDAGSINILYE